MERKKLILQLRKAGAQFVSVGTYDDTLAVECKWPDAGPCSKEHADLDEISEEEWERRHAWNEKFGEISVEEAEDVYSEIGFLRKEIKRLVGENAFLSRQMEDKWDSIETRDIPDYSAEKDVLEPAEAPSSPGSIADVFEGIQKVREDFKTDAKRSLDLPTDDDQFGSWYDSNPRPPHFNR